MLQACSVENSYTASQLAISYTEINDILVKVMQINKN